MIKSTNAPNYKRVDFQKKKWFFVAVQFLKLEGSFPVVAQRDLSEFTGMNG